MLNSYSNPDNDHCAGGHCELIPLVQGPCDNQFEFCLRVVGSSSCLTHTITSQGLIEADEIMFTKDDLEQLGINNPLQVLGIATSVCPTMYYMVVMHNTHGLNVFGSFMLLYQSTILYRCHWSWL